MRKILFLVTILSLALSVSGHKLCECDGDDCGCCEHVSIKHPIPLDNEACLNITYVPSTITLDLTFTWGNETLVNKSVSALDPDICFGIPHIPIVDLCLNFTKMNITKEFVSGCVDLEIKAAMIKVADFHLGCFKINYFWELSNLSLKYALPESDEDDATGQKIVPEGMARREKNSPVDLSQIGVVRRIIEGLRSTKPIRAD